MVILLLCWLLLCDLRENRMSAEKNVCSILVSTVLVYIITIVCKQNNSVCIVSLFMLCTTVHNTLNYIFINCVYCLSPNPPPPCHFSSSPPGAQSRRLVIEGPRRNPKQRWNLLLLYSRKISKYITALEEKNSKQISPIDGHAAISHNNIACDIILLYL